MERDKYIHVPFDIIVRKDVLYYFRDSDCATQLLVVNKKQSCARYCTSSEKKHDETLGKTILLELGRKKSTRSCRGQVDKDARPCPQRNTLGIQLVRPKHFLIPLVVICCILAQTECPFFEFPA